MKYNRTNTVLNKKMDSLSLENELLQVIQRIPEAEQKAKAARRFADGHIAFGNKVFKSAWDEGGPHCLLSTMTPFDEKILKLVTTSTVGAVEHAVYIANELHKMDLVRMPMRRDIRGVKRYLNKVLECYTYEFYPLATGVALPRLTESSSMGDAVNTFHAVISCFPRDLSPHVITDNMSPIAEIMLNHARSDADKADVEKFISTYNPFSPRPNILGKALKDRLTRNASKAVRSSAPGPIAFRVALVTALQALPSPQNGLSSFHGEAA